MFWRLIKLLVVSVALSTSALLSAQEPASSATTGAAVDRLGHWVTLGTRGGPVTSPTRSQPANFLEYRGCRYLVDSGDGASDQLAKVGIQTAQLDGIFISHLHFDHTGGIFAVLGLRLQTDAPKPLQIWGPPGTKETIDGLIAAMVPGATAGYGLPGAVVEDPAKSVTVTEIKDGDTFDVCGMKVSVRRNTHYSFPPGSELAKHFQSLSYRFDLAGRSIVYTGDTGPSDAVEELARGADLLVTEMIDVDNTIAIVRHNQKGAPEQVLQAIERHLREHHLTPAGVGKLAAEAKVGAVVVTHFTGREPQDPAHLDYLREISAQFQGPVVIANDLDEF